MQERISNNNKNHKTWKSCFAWWLHKYLEIPSGSEGRVSLLFPSIYDHGFLFLHQVYSTLRVNVTKPCGMTLCSLNSLFYIFPAHKKNTLFKAPKQNVTNSAVLHVNLIVQTFTSTAGLIFIQNSYLSVIKKLIRWSTARRIKKRKRTDQIRALSWWVKNNVLVSCSKS